MKKLIVMAAMLLSVIGFTSQQETDDCIAAFLDAI